MTKQQQTRIELLAPAKDLECGLAAIDCGADAVYLGAPRFGARAQAGNSLEDIAGLAEYAHRYWAKVYVTVNTLLFDDEIPEAVKLIRQLYDIGIDGLIIQDAGLLECDLPPLPLIASTQMHNHTPERVAFLEQVGFQRAILARELSLEQIREIRRKTTIELECFIHGALCVCYSGQCYLSYALGGRSGNRGQCAQPCRKSYTLQDSRGETLERDRHLLSLRDLNLTGSLRELIDAGVCSFKIEGRLKDQTYIMNVVSHYRQALDAVLGETDQRKASSGASSIDFTPDPDKTFNRGYTTHFLYGRGAEVASPATPKMVGERVGEVTATSPRSFTITTALTLHNGDGICFFDRQGELRGSVINAVQGQVVTPAKMDGIERGTLLFRNHDHAFLSQLTKARVERCIDVRFTLRETKDGFVLLATDEDSNTAEYALASEKVTAEKPEQAPANIRKQLNKVGGTGYTCADIVIELSQPYFIPVSTLNALRRGALEELVKVRTRNRPRLTGGPIRNLAPYPEKKLTFRANVLNKQAALFYRRHGVALVQPGAESGIDFRGKKLMITKYCLKYQLGGCQKTKNPVHLAEPLTLIDTEGHRLELHFDCAACEMAISFCAENRPK